MANTKNTQGNKDAVIAALKDELEQKEKELERAKMWHTQMAQRIDELQEYTCRLVTRNLWQRLFNTLDV